MLQDFLIYLLSVCGIIGSCFGLAWFICWGDDYPHTRHKQLRRDIKRRKQAQANQRAAWGN